MKFFVYLGLIIGILVTAVGLFIASDKLNYLVYGIPVPATVIGFQEDEDYVRISKRVKEYMTVYYPILEYQFRGARYEIVSPTRQTDRSKPYSTRSSVTLLCVADRPSDPFIGSYLQLLFIKMSVPIIGLAITLIAGIMGLIAWWKGDLQTQPVMYPCRF